MKRKRFEKLMISQHKSQARDIRQAVRTIIELRHQHHNEPGMSPHHNAACAQTLKAVAQAKYEEKNGPGAHAAWMAAVGKDYINA